MPEPHRCNTRSMFMLRNLQPNFALIEMTRGKNAANALPFNWMREMLTSGGHIFAGTIERCCYVNPYNRFHCLRHSGKFSARKSSSAPALARLEMPPTPLGPASSNSLKRHRQKRNACVALPRSCNHPAFQAQSAHLNGAANSAAIWATWARCCPNGCHSAIGRPGRLCANILLF